MKKLIMLFLLVFTFFIFQMFELQAEGEYYPLPVGRNYLDLGNLTPRSDDPNYAYTIDPIRVIPNETYTIVLDYEFLGQHSDFLEFVYILIEEYTDTDQYNLLINDDRTNLRAYIEFEPVTDLILITSLPMMPTTYDAIMYVGTYPDFDGYEPYIDPSEVMSYFGVLPVDYDELLTTQEIKNYLQANDPYGNPLSISIEEDEYSLSNKLPGTYQMIFMSTFNNITKRYYLDVRVFDATAPVIASIGYITMPLTEKASVASIVSQISVSDNVDDMDSTDLVITTDTYTPANQVGLYEVIVSATDLSGNTSQLTVEIELIDRHGPDITGPASIYLYTKDEPLTNLLILNKYLILDDVDGLNVTASFEFNDYNQNTMPGIYMLTILASDTLNNISRFSLNIHVIENGGPVFTTDEIVLSIDTASEMSDDQLIEWFTNHTLSSGYSVSHVRVMFNEYKNMENTEGSYYVYLSYQVNGEQQTSRIRIDVENQDDKPNFYVYLALGCPVLLGIAGFIFIKHRKKQIIKKRIDSNFKLGYNSSCAGVAKLADALLRIQRHWRAGSNPVTRTTS